MDKEKREQEIILDTPSFTFAGLEAIDLGVAALVSFIATAVALFFLPFKALSFVVFFLVMFFTCMRIKNAKGGKGWGWTVRYILGKVKGMSRRKVYVL